MRWDLTSLVEISIDYNIFRVSWPCQHVPLQARSQQVSARAVGAVESGGDRGGEAAHLDEHLSPFTNEAFLPRIPAIAP